MKEPFKTIWEYYVFKGKPIPYIREYKVKFSTTGEAIYIGTDNEHITILKNAIGFHHSKNVSGKHITGRQHQAHTLQEVIEHVEFNLHDNTSYDGSEILQALKYINANK